MSFPYEHNSKGLWVIIGLTEKETEELETLDRLSPFADDGETIGWCFEGRPTAKREQRWLYLYEKHRAAVAIRNLWGPRENKQQIIR